MATTEVVHTWPKGFKTFMAQWEASRQFIQMAPASLDVELLARQALEEQLSGDLRGPRGGRYVPVGPVRHLGSSPEPGFTRGTITWAARRDARYVRPKR